MKRFPILMFLLLFLGVERSDAQFYYGMQNDFGKNRIQYREFPWQFYRFENFDTYFYQGGQPVAEYVARCATQNIKEIQEMFDFVIDQNIQFIIYNKQSDFTQSNIGLVTKDDYNIGGVTRISGSKVFIFNEGDRLKLEQQVRAGITEVLVSQLMYGGNWKDVVKNSYLLNLPDWYVKGLISYVSNEWNAEIDNRVRDGIMSGRYKRFNNLTGADAVYAGHSIWKYIVDTYGKSTLPNILYMSRVSRNVEAGYLFVLGTSLKSLSRDWREYYRKIYTDPELEKQLDISNALVKRPKSTRVYTQYKVSPDGKFATYATNELGQIKLYLVDLEKGKRKRIYKTGSKLNRINDYSVPVVSWHPNSELFAFVTEQKGQVTLSFYDLESKKIEKRPPLFNFEKVLDFTYSSDGKKMVMSAVVNGQTDIYVFTIASNTLEQITKDAYDDINPRFTKRSSSIVFASNRENDTLTVNERIPQEFNKDIFEYNYASKSPVLRRITNTQDVNELQPYEYDPQHIVYLSDENGIFNRFVARFDSVISYIDTAAHYRYHTITRPLTNYPRNILEHSVNAENKTYSQIIFRNGKYRLLKGSLESLTAEVPLKMKPTFYRGQTIAIDMAIAEAEEKAREYASKNVDQKVTKKPEAARDTSAKRSDRVDINNYVFEGENVTRPSTPAQDTLTVYKDSLLITKEETFSLPRQRNYMRTFLPEKFTSQMSPGFLGFEYQRFNGYDVPYNSPGFGLLLKGAASDVFENYRFSAGVRFPFSMDSKEFFISYEDREKRLDKEILLFRQTFTPTRFNAPKVYTHSAKYILKYPFSEVAAVKGTFAYRNDKAVYLSTDLVNLNRSDEYSHWANAKVEYIYDNTLPLGINLMHGTRLKLWVEYYNQVLKQNQDITILGFDVRNYIRIHRDFIWANRIAGSTSLGSQKLLYYLGAVDNWINIGKNPTFNTNVPVDVQENYGFQTIATNMRGFNQNIRNGNSFVVINSELRWPMFKYIFNRPLKSDFLTNFQVVGFGDIGSAWTGMTPYSNDNSFNTKIITAYPIQVTLKSEREPIVGGYGFGFRSRIWGYFIRTDWAWGVEDQEVQPRFFYISLGLDF